MFLFDFKDKSLQCQRVTLVEFYFILFTLYGRNGIFINRIVRISFIYQIRKYINSISVYVQQSICQTKLLFLAIKLQTYFEVLQQIDYSSLLKNNK